MYDLSLRVTGARDEYMDPGNCMNLFGKRKIGQKEERKREREGVRREEREYDE